MSWWRHFNITMTSQIDVWLFVFYLCHGLEWVCEIELSHMGKNNGNPDLVCEKNSADPEQTASEEEVWSGSSLFAILTSTLWILALITHTFFENRKWKMFEILEHYHIWAKMRENWTLLHATNRGADQHVHQCSLISTFEKHYYRLNLLD